MTFTHFVGGCFGSGWIAEGFDGNDAKDSKTYVAKQFSDMIFSRKIKCILVNIRIDWIELDWIRLDFPI